MKEIIAVVLLVCATSLSVPAQKTDKKPKGNSKIERLILQLEKEGREATLKNDLEMNDRLLADNWMNTNVNGTVTTKAQLLELIKSNTFKITSIESDDVMVRVYGDSAVVTGRSTSTRMRPDNQAVTGQVRFIRVYSKIGGRWRVVAAQSTPIRTQ